MPNIGAYHPVIVHFAIALLIIGVIFRWVSLSGRAAFTGPAAATLLIRGRLEKARGALWGSAIVGLIGVFPLFAAADHGGDLVYSYAGGVGTRSGDTADVSRLYLAGLYQAAQQARTQHDSARAAELFGKLEREFPNDTTVRLLAIESLVRDRNDGRMALAALSRFPLPADDRRLQLRVGFLKADAYVAAGKPDSARAVLEQLGNAFPDMQQRIKDRIAQIK